MINLPIPTATEKKNSAALLLEATTRVFAQKPHTLTFLACAAAIPAWLKNYGLATIPEVSFTEHFVPWTAFCGVFYSIANVLIGVSVAAPDEGNNDDNSGDDEESIER